MIYNRGLTLAQYRERFKEYCDEYYSFEDELTLEELKEQFIYSNYGNSTTAYYLRKEL